MWDGYVVCVLGWGTMGKSDVAREKAKIALSANAGNSGSQFRDINTTSLPVARGVYRTFGKRLLDVVFAIAAVPLVLPVFAALYFLVTRDGGPFLYRHSRIGKDGQVFACLKIRTMIVGSESALKELLERSPDARKEWNETFKLKNDPRITPIGRLLRKTSLDELPQIFNVVLGDMSFVGPRPITAEELVLYGEAAKFYKSVRPGLTGPWQVAERRDNDFGSRISRDTEYVQNIGLFSDLYYIFATVPEVLFCKGR